MTDMTAIQDQMKAIATAHTDYAKSSFEANKSYLEQLATSKAPDQAMQLMTDHMKTSYETFVAEAQKIGDMYKSLFNTALLPVTEAMQSLRLSARTPIGLDTKSPPERQAFLDKPRSGRQRCCVHAPAPSCATSFILTVWDPSTRFRELLHKH